MMFNFMSEEHKDFYFKQIAKTESVNDPYRKALFYTLGLTGETRSNITALYNFEEGSIEFDGIKSAWQTGTTLKVTKLAFNLYNGYAGEVDESDSPSRYTPYSLFDCELMPYMLEAVKVLLKHETTE